MLSIVKIPEKVPLLSDFIYEAIYTSEGYTRPSKDIVNTPEMHVYVRDFGKSLLVSAFESYFSGEKELFKGLYIEENENARGEDAWTKYPVISFYLSGGDYNSPVGLTDTLNFVLDSCIDKYHLDKDSIAGDTLSVLMNIVTHPYC